MNQYLAHLKKKIRPIYGYAFLLSAGTLALTATVKTASTDTVVATPPPIGIIASEPAKPASVPELWAPDLGSLKASAKTFKNALTETKVRVDALNQQGRVPPPELINAFGQADQIVGIIEQAQALSDLNGMDAGAIMLKISQDINKYSAY
jgi:hypothetical protein